MINKLTMKILFWVAMLFGSLGLVLYTFSLITNTFNFIGFDFEILMENSLIIGVVSSGVYLFISYLQFFYNESEE